MKFFLPWLVLVPLSPLAAHDLAEPIGTYEMAYPYPSPDGLSVVFQGNFDGRWQLYEIVLESGVVSRIHESASDDSQPAWSPDGHGVAFVSNRDGNDEIYILDIASGNASVIAPHPGKDGHPKWSADGEWLVFNRTFSPEDVDGDIDSAIIRVREDGSQLSVISDTPNIETFASLSPDNSSVAFIEWIADEDGNMMGDVIVVDIAAQKRRNLTQSPDFDAYPIWGPSGDWIYFSTFEQTSDGDEVAILYRIDPAGEHRERLSDVGSSPTLRAVPSLDEKTLFFNSVRHGDMLIFSTEL